MKILIKFFTSFYFITAVLAALAVFGIQAALREYESYLEEYEALQPVYTFDRVMDTYFKAPDFKEWAAKEP